MILKAKKKDLGSIVKIHLNVLSQTFNSRIGDKFLYNLYDILLRNPDVARIWVVKKNDKVAGFISVCQDFKKVGKTINKNTKRKYILLLLKFLLLNPGEIISFSKRLVFSRFINNNFSEPYSTILTLGVHRKYQGVGLGSLLVKKSKSYFKKRGVKFLYVDTERNNLNAILFYKKMGFRPIKEFLGNLILRTKINV